MTNFDSGGDVEMTSFENPMQDKGVKNEINKQKRNLRMKKVRKKLSVGARVKRNSHGQSVGEDSMGGEIKLSVPNVVQVPGVADSISVDVTCNE